MEGRCVVALIRWEDVVKLIWREEVGVEGDAFVVGAPVFVVAC